MTLSIHASFFAVMAPLKMFIVLQCLGLLPDRMWLPPFKAFIPFSPSSPLCLPELPASVTWSPMSGFASSIAFSPPVLWYMMTIIQPPIFRKLQTYIRAALPKPYRPDSYSLEAAKVEGLGNDSVPGLCNAHNVNVACWESYTFLEELAKDLQLIGRKSQMLYDQCFKTRRRTTTPSTEPIDPFETLELDDDRPEIPRRESSPILPTATTPSESSEPTTRPSMPQTVIEIAASSPAAGIHQMNVPFPLRTPPPRNEINFVLDQHVAKASTPLHRITSMSAFAADTMSHHLASHLVDILFLPLEALFVRSLVTGFLSSPRAGPQAQAVAARWKGEVYPLGTWFGMGPRGGWRSMVDYAGKMVLVLGMQMGVHLTAWQICTGVAWVIGKRRFGWGRL